RPGVELRRSRDSDAQRLPRHVVGDHRNRIPVGSADGRNSEHHSVRVQALPPVLVADEEARAAIAKSPYVAAEIDGRVPYIVALHRRGRILLLHLPGVEILVVERAALDVAEAQIPLDEPTVRETLASVQLQRMRLEVLVGEHRRRVAERWIRSLRVVAPRARAAAVPIAHAKLVALLLRMRGEAQREQQDEGGKAHAVAV